MSKEEEEELKGLYDYKETLSDIDDNEIQDYIYTKQESQLKYYLWNHAHKGWLREQQDKKSIFLKISIF